MDVPPAAVAPNATAEHEAAGGDFDAALAAAMADDTSDGVSVETETAEDVNAPKPVAGKTADEAAKDETDVETKTAKPAEPKKEPEDSEAKKLRAGFSALARDRAKLRDREASAVAREQAATQYHQKAQLLDQVLARLDSDPVGVIRERGGDELINKLLDGVIASEKSPAEREVAKMRAELQARDAQIKAREEAALIDSWKNQIRREVSSAAETYDLINSLDQHDAVIATIEAYYVRYNGAILPTADAAQAVEDTLAKGLAKSKKFGTRAPVTNAQPVPGKTAPASRKAGSVTLASVHSSELPSGDGDDLPLDDPNERFRRVMAGLG